MKKIVFWLFIIPILILVLLGLCVWGFTPAAVSYLAVKPLTELGLSLDKDAVVRYNPFISSLNITNLSLSRDKTHPLKIKSLTLELDLHKAIFGDLHVKQFKIDGVDLEVSSVNETLIVGGLSLPNSEPSDELVDTPKPEASQRSLILPEFILTNCRVVYVDEKISEEFHIDSLRVTGGDIHSAYQKMSIELKAQLFKSTILINSNVDILNGRGIVDSHVQVNDLHLNLLQNYLSTNEVVLNTGLLNVESNPVIKLIDGSYDLSMDSLSLGLRQLNMEYDSQTFKVEDEVRFTVKAIKLKEGALSVENIIIDSLKSAIELNPASETSLKTSTPAPEPEKNKHKDETKEKPLAIDIKSLSVAGDTVIKFKDNRVSPPYARDFSIEKAEIRQVNNSEKGESPFELIMKSNKYAQVEMRGEIELFSKDVNLNVAGSVLEVSLPAISSYIKDSIGFELEAGQFDSALKVGIDDGVINGDIELHLRGLKLERADPESVSTIQAQTSLPLNYALGMLQDKYGNVKLKVPLTGSIDDPNFGLNSFVTILTKKAVMSAAKSYLMKTFVPYSNVVSVAMSAGGFVFKLRFNDLEYAAGQVDLNELQGEYLNQFITLMKKKSQAQVKICGVATVDDIAGLPMPLDESQAIYKESVIALKNVATKRAENFKAMAVEKGGLSSARMLICNPSVDLGKGAKPKIEISI